MLALAAAVTVSPANSWVGHFALAEHIGVFCLLALTGLLSPLHHVFEAAVAGGLLYALYDRTQAIRSTNALLRELSGTPVPPGSGLHVAVIHAGVDPDRVALLAGSPLPAFTVGALRPRIFVSERLEEILSREELIAVLAHEGAHLRRRDPLRFSLMRFVSRALFWLPVLRSLERHFLEETELRADAAAASKSGVLTASALLLLTQHFGRPTASLLTAGLSPHAFLAMRVRVLTGSVGATLTAVSRRAVLLSLAAIVLLWTVAMAELHQSAHGQHTEPAAESDRCAASGRDFLDRVACISTRYHSAGDASSRTGDR
jgi:hypothetical protein